MKLGEASISHWIERMRQIAHSAHKGQKRNDGRPYIEHPERVAVAVEDRLKPIALGHDLCEDTKVTLDDLKAEGFPSYIIDAVGLLTHRREDTNMAYWKKILTNPDAVAVKIADIKDNLADQPNEYQKQKYARALKVFQDNGASV